MARNSNIKAVAQTVQKQILNGERPNVKKAMIQNGYSVKTASNSSYQVTRHPDYKAEEKNFVNQIQELQQDAISIMLKKKNKASYRDALNAIVDLKRTETLITGTAPTDIIAVKWVE